MVLPVKFIIVNILLFGMLGSLKAQNQSCNNDLEKESQLRKERFKQWSVGTQVPDINLSGSKSLYNSKAGTTLILFWKTDCPYCEKLIPELEKLSKEYDAKELSIIAVCLDNNLEDWKEQEKVKNPLKLWFHKCDGKSYGGEDAVNYHVFGTPTLLLVDKNHRIKGHPKSLDQIRELIDRSGNQR